jgi:hypothetical protein
LGPCGWRAAAAASSKAEICGAAGGTLRPCWPSTLDFFCGVGRNDEPSVPPARVNGHRPSGSVAAIGTARTPEHRADRLISHVVRDQPVTVCNEPPVRAEGKWCVSRWACLCCRGERHRVTVTVYRTVLGRCSLC